MKWVWNWCRFFPSIKNLEVDFTYNAYSNDNIDDDSNALHIQ